MKMNDYVNIAKKNIKNDNSRMIMVNQIKRYFDCENRYIDLKKYEIGDEVFLKKGTLLHGTYKNLDGLKEIVNNGLISSWFIDGRLSKYPSSVGVWNLKHDYKLSEYINFYSGGTILYAGVFENGVDTQKNKTDIIPYDEMNNIIDITTSVNCHMWTLEQTKEARFMPSLVQNNVQIGIIFNGQNDGTKELLKCDILSNSINDEDVKEFVNSNYYDKFIRNRKNKDDFFTDRESAILFGLPSNLIEGILVGRKYEKDNQIIKKIKSLLPDCYICNLDGIVIA